MALLTLFLCPDTEIINHQKNKTMKKLKSFIFLAACILSVPLSAQTLKSYSGPYPHSQGALIGEAKYSYTETEDGERIKQGAFRFTTQAGEERVVSVQGSYKGGEKEGKWTTKIVLKKPMIGVDRPSNNLEALISNGVSIMSGNFVDNKRTSQWNYLGGRAADNVSRTSTKSTANFTDDLLNGAFSYTYEDPQGKCILYAFSAQGGFDNGLIDGKWTIKYTDQSKIEKIQTMIFDKGKLMSSKIVNIATSNATTPTSYEYSRCTFNPEAELGLKVALYNYFRMFQPELARVFQIWMGDPSLERRDGFLSDEKEKFCGFAFYPKKS